jgi:hypothetical protein
MIHMGNILESIKKEILSWPHVTAEPHRFGGLEFKYDKREMGYIHGNTVVDFPFPLQLRKELVSSGKVSLHYVLPDSGWASYWIKSDADPEKIIELFRIQYERLRPKEQPFAIPNIKSIKKCLSYVLQNRNFFTP